MGNTSAMTAKIIIEFMVSMSPSNLGQQAKRNPQTGVDSAGMAAPFQLHIRFKWHSAFTLTTYDITDVLEFDANRNLGTLQDPVVLHFPKDDREIDVEGGLVAFPNPFNDELTIHWHGVEKVIELRVEDTSGRLIDILDCDHLGAGPCKWNAQAAESGMYVIHAITEERSYSVRVIK